MFADLKKADDSVPREVWRSLMKLGVPDLLLKLIRSFHQDMNAKVRMEENLLEPTEVRNGLRQGCYMAPVLFNLLARAVMERWMERAQEGEEEGVKLKYMHGGNIFRRFVSNVSVSVLTECLFAHDGYLLASSRWC